MSTATDARGNRLTPRFSHPRYCILRSLASSMQAIASSEHVGRGGTLLDYGCGNMPYQPLFSPRFDHYVGADLPGNDLADIALNPDGTIPLGAEEIDCVLSSQVLEHVTNPDSYLKESLRVLKRDGSLILSTHGIWMYHPDPTDYWRWTSDGLTRIIVQAGFSVITIQSVMNMASTALQLWQDATMRKVPRLLRPAYVTLMQSSMLLTEQMGKTGFSPTASVYIVIARKAS